MVYRGGERLSRAGSHIRAGGEPGPRPPGPCVDYQGRARFRRVGVEPPRFRVGQAHAQASAGFGGERRHNRIVATPFPLSSDTGGFGASWY